MRAVLFLFLLFSLGANAQGKYTYKDSTGQQVVIDPDHPFPKEIDSVFFKSQVLGKNFLSASMTGNGPCEICIREVKRIKKNKKYELKVTVKFQQKNQALPNLENDYYAMTVARSKGSLKLVSIKYLFIEI